MQRKGRNSDVCKGPPEFDLKRRIEREMVEESESFMGNKEREGQKERFQHLDRWVFPIVVLVFGAVCMWSSISLMEPYGKHQWRQCDAYSMAVNYFQEDLKFARPEMHFQHGNGLGSGQAIGEFTATYWLNAQLWKCIGLTPFTMRWTHLLLWLLGCLALFSMSKQWFGPYKAGFVILCVLSSPLIVFYAPNYLVNVAGLGMVFLAWWAAWQIMTRQKRTVLLEGTLFVALSLSILFRPTMLLGWLPIGVGVLFKGKIGHWFWRFFCPLVLGISWILWSKSLNRDAGSVYFLTTIRPLWHAADAAEVWRLFREDVLPEWYHTYVRSLFVLVVGTIAFMVAKTRGKIEGNSVAPQTPNHFGMLVAIMLVGLGVYFVLWFENLDVHDYYLIEFQLLVPLVLWWLIFHLDRMRGHNGRFYKVTWGVLLVAVSFQLLESHLRTRMKYKAPTGLLSELILTERDRGIWNWFHWDQVNRFEHFLELKKEMRDYGITRESRIISVPDPSPNITLSLLDQKGFTNLYDENMTGDDRIRFYVEKGAVYLVCNSKDWWEERGDSEWLQHPIIRVHDLVVFDLLNSAAPLPDNARE